MSELTPHRRVRHDVMRRLGGDGGAVSTIVAILLAAGVLLGIGALAIDVGTLYHEREQQQSGADAAALYVARVCATIPGDCQAVASTSGTTFTDASGRTMKTAGWYANHNAKDNTSGITTVCSNSPAAQALGLPACPPLTTPSTQLSRCIGNAPTNGTPYVEVRTHVRNTNGTTILPPVFARTLAGNSGDQGSAVSACSRASWGPPKSAVGIAATISICEWNASTASGGNLAPPPPYTTPYPASLYAAEQVVYLHGTGTSTTAGGTADACNTTVPAGWNAPGGFGWLDDSGQCQATITAGDTADGDTGASADSACKTRLQNYLSSRQVIYMPIYDGVQGTGTGTTYHIVGMAAFVLTGYNLPSNSLKAASWLTGKNYCKGNDKCLYGFFVKPLLPVGAVVGGTGTDLGVSAVSLIG